MSNEVNPSLENKIYKIESSRRQHKMLENGEVSDSGSVTSLGNIWDVTLRSNQEDSIFF